MSLNKSEWFFIVNPRAGSGKTMSKWVPAEKKLAKLGISYETAYTDHKRHATSLAYDAAEEGYRNIAAVGGDGSLHECLDGILKWCAKNSANPSEFKICVVPIGSGNDWIKTLNVPNDSMDVIGLIAKNSFREIDAVRVSLENGKIACMANIGGMGFDSHVCERVNSQKERGMRGKRIYLNALIHTIFHLNAINLKVLADDVEVFSGQAYSVALGNGKYSGSGMRQVPLADINDCLVDYTIIPKLSIFKMLTKIPKLFSGKINEVPELITGRCRKLMIAPLDAASADIVELDGEIEGRLPLCIEMSGEKIQALSGKEN